MNNIEKSKWHRFYTKGFYGIEFIVSLVLAITLFQFICDKVYFSIMKSRNIILCFLLALILIVMIIIKFKKEYHHYEKIFLIFMIPIGIFYLVFLIPGQVPDEHAHLSRIWDISQGNIIMDVKEQKQHIPIKISTMGMEKLRYDTFIKRINLQKYDYREIDEEGKYNAACTYFPIPYLIPALVVKLGVVFQCNFFIVLYLARISNFLLALIVGYYAIKKIPIGKLLLLTYLFNPMYIQQSMSLSADSLINISIIFFISYTMYLLFKKEEMSKQDQLIYGSLFMIAFLNKLAYYPIALISLVLVFGKNKREKKMERIYISICLIALTIMTVAWGIFSMQYKDERKAIKENHVNSKQQIEYVLEQPLHYLKMLGNTVKQKGEAWIQFFFGIRLGCMDVRCPTIWGRILLFILLIAPFLEQNDHALNKKQKIWFMLLVFGTCILIITALYLIWTTVGADIAQGIQGRYFIPIVLLIVLCLCMPGKYKEFKYTKLTYMMILLTINIGSIYRIIEFFAMPFLE